ncbi:hypothetical protein F4775DRAFT_534003 [Biscogniauxia sp. FL1348]|nr:hypothetical protein F4775DRAFT_534003 [Biscogniauxia sp. FL1348]
MSDNALYRFFTHILMFSCMIFAMHPNPVSVWKNLTRLKKKGGGREVIVGNGIFLAGPASSAKWGWLVFLLI